MEDDTGRVWWETKSFYQPDQDDPYAIIVLNEALDNINMTFFTTLWQKATLRVCVDGATNLYHKIALSIKTQPRKMPYVNGEKALESDFANLSLAPEGLKLPSFISGDFDSVYPELLTHYSSLGVSVFPTPSQDETDFTKAVRELGKYIAQRNIQVKHVVVLAAVRNDRFDHVIANLSTLYKVRNLIQVPLVVISGPSLFWLLDAGDHTIKVPEELLLNAHRSWCGLAPLSHPATVTTTGLKWNLDNQVLGFGHLVSTSNTYDPTHEGIITVTTCEPLLWTMGWDIDKTYPADDRDINSCALNSCSAEDLSPTPIPTVTGEIDHVNESDAYGP